MKRFAFAFALALLAASPAAADSNRPPAPYANRPLADPAAEARARALMDEIRCLVCEGQSIADSDAELAGDMRAMIRTRIADGESAADIRDWLVARYGGWISYRPVVTPLTWPLFLLPLLFLVGGAWLVRGRLGRGARR